jgi:acetolactate synthase I/II/III large subunit
MLLAESVRRRASQTVAGGLGQGVAAPALASCDVLLVVGASLNQWTTHHGDLIKGKRVVQIDADLDAFGKYARADVMLHADALETSRALLHRVRLSAHSERREQHSLLPLIEAGWRKHRAPIAYEVAADGTIDPRQAVRELDRLLPKDRLVIAAGGHSGFLVSQFLQMRAPRDWNYTIDFGALGPSAEPQSCSTRVTSLVRFKASNQASR